MTCRSSSYLKLRVVSLATASRFSRLSLKESSRSSWSAVNRSLTYGSVKRVRFQIHSKVCHKQKQTPNKSQGLLSQKLVKINSTSFTVSASPLKESRRRVKISSPWRLLTPRSYLRYMSRAKLCGVRANIS